jgi:glutathione S-transferase
MKLHAYVGSANAYKIELALAQLGAPYQRVEVEIFRGEGRSADFLRKNPAGRVPVLELDDGTCIAESGAILWHVARGTRLLPDDALTQTRILSWLFFEQNEIEPVLGSARYWRLTGRDRERADETERRIAQAGRALALLDGALAASTGERPFLVGAYSIADIALYAYTHLAGDVGLRLPAQVAAWCARVEAQPGFIAGPGPYTDAAMLR